jgi:hypothetical protein
MYIINFTFVISNENQRYFILTNSGAAFKNPFDLIDEE